MCFLLMAAQGWGQKQLQKLVAHADQQVLALDYIEALKYYQQALALEPNSITLHWKIAQANAQFKDYKTAARYYLKVFEQDPEGLQFADAQLQYALMLKQQGSYKEALAQFKEAKKFFDEDKTSYAYLKAQQEVLACSWVLKQLKFLSAEESEALQKHPANTIDAEFGHLFWNDTLIYSSLKADSIADDQEQIISKKYQLDLYQFPERPTEKNWLVGQNPAFEYGNFCISPDSSSAFCSECTRENTGYKCRIVRALPSQGQWFLDSSYRFKETYSYSSMPHILIFNNELQLIFCAQSQEGKGGTDLWIAKLNTEGEIQESQNLSALNSPENEVSPWYDPLFKRLYFSSTWHSGFGGFDIFYSTLQTDGKFGPPINLGMPFNSPANDLYFFCEADTAYLSSNRIGSLYASHPTCCSDIFYREFDRPETKKDPVVAPPAQIVHLPIRLYFENDHPNPKTTADFTEFTYDETYIKYKSQYPVYLQKVAEGREQTAAVEQTQALYDFFENEVDKGMNDLALFREQVWQALQSGNQVSIMVQGFASPLAKSDYNVHLTSRRISSIKNYFEEIDGGKFAAYMLTTPVRLQFVEVPMGEFQAKKDVSDNYYDQRNSVYSKDASLERRIEIIELRSEPLSPK
jgi:tetratricopeptide (TPR) repeat protein